MITDFHSHILPGVDDGSQSLDQSLKMLAMEAEQGIRRVVATPHFYPRYDAPERFREKRNRAEALLRQAMPQLPGCPEIEIGAEVYYFRGISESDVLPELTIRGSRSIMIELPLPPWEGEIWQELADIWDQWGIIPIVAHIDRYIAPFRTHGIPRRLAEMPVMVQANASFFLNRQTAALAMKLLKNDQIQLLGSDCHDTAQRAPNLAQAMDAIRAKLGEEPLERIIHYERNILGDLP